MSSKSNRAKYEKNHHSGEGRKSSSPVVGGKGDSSSKGRTGNRRRYIPDKEERLRLKRRRRRIKMGVLLGFFLVVAALVWWAWSVSGSPNPFPGQNSTPAVTADIDTNRDDIHCYFLIGGQDGFNLEEPENPIPLNSVTLERDGNVMVSLEGAGEVLSLTVEKEGEDFKVTKGDKTLVLTAGSDTATMGQETVELGYPCSYCEDIFYVPIESVAQALGFATECTHDSNRLDVYMDNGTSTPPKAVFTTDKDTYAPGEEVKFTVLSGDGEDGVVVDYKWENRKSRYFNPGKETITLTVKDYKGQWSPVASKEITIEDKPYEAASVTPVLMYHWIAENEADVQPGGKEYKNAAVIGLEQFRREMHYIKDNGYNTITVSDFLSYLESGTLPPPKTVVIIFDDGYENNYTLGFPILKELGLKASIAVILAHSVDKDTTLGHVEPSTPRLSMSQIKEMQASGIIEIGSHSFSGHLPLDRYLCDTGYYLAKPAYDTALWRDETQTEYVYRIRDDAHRAKVILSEELGVKNPFFVYPYGRVSTALTDTIKDTGFTSAFIIGNKYATANSDLYHIPRFTVYPSTTPQQYAAMLNGTCVQP